MRFTYAALAGVTLLGVTFLPAATSAQSSDSILALARAGHGTAYITRAESLEGDLVKLQNGAVLEVAYMSYYSYGVPAIFFRLAGRGCELHVRGRSARCNIVRPPQGDGQACQKTAVSEVRAGGRVIRLLDGSLYEVPYQPFLTALWAYNQVLLCGLTIVDLSTAHEVIVQPL